MKSWNVSGGQSRHFIQLNSTQLNFDFNIKICGVQGHVMTDSPGHHDPVVKMDG